MIQSGNLNASRVMRTFGTFCVPASESRLEVEALINPLDFESTASVRRQMPFSSLLSWLSDMIDEH
jgi:hypothetical protein